MFRILQAEENILKKQEEKRTSTATIGESKRRLVRHTLNIIIRTNINFKKSNKKN